MVIIIMDNRAITPLVGFILILLLVMIGLGIVQSTLPGKYKQVEAQHLRELQSQFLNLKNTPTSATSYKLDMGVEYPQSLFLSTPSTQSTTISFEDFNLKLDYKEVLTNGSEVHRTRNLTSSRISIAPNYMYYPEESLIMENSAVFKNISGGGYIEVSDQLQFTDTARIEILSSTYNSSSRSISTKDPISIIKNPVSRGGYVQAENLTVTFESVYPQYWKDIEGYNVSVDGNTVTMEKDGTVILSIYRSSIGTSATSDTSSYLTAQTRIVKKYDYVLKLKSGETDILNLIEVIDGYNNPIPGYRVEGSSSIGSLRTSTEFTNTYGEAHFTYDAPAVDECRIGNITFTCPECTGQHSVSYGILITEPDGTCTQSFCGDDASVYEGNTSIKPPYTNNIPSTEVTDKSYISEDDNVYLQTLADDGSYAAHRFNFSVGSLVEKISVRWNGKGGSHDNNGATLYIWNKAENEYAVLDTEYHSSGETWLEAVIDSRTQDYISSGCVTLLVIQNGDEASKLYSDYLVVNTE